MTATKSLSIAVSLPTALSITTTTLSNGILNQPYSQSVLASGGSGTRNWSFQGGTIPNLNINSSTGVITGNPTPTGNFTFTVQVTDALFTATQQFTIAITAPPAPSITTSSLPTGTVNIPYSAQLQAINGAPPLNFQPVGLPFGLTFNVTPNSSTATITGTPTSDGSQNVTFTVNDSTVPFNQTGSATLTLTVNKTLTISTPSPLPSGTKGTLYSFQLLASGGTPLPGPSYSWSLVNGFPSLPPGLTLHPSGLIDGTPTNTVNVTVTPRFRVQDAVPTAVTKDLTITVNATLTIDTTSPLTPGVAGQPYSFQLMASGGTGPGTYTWTLSDPGNYPLPAGFTLDPTGLLSSASTAAGSYTLKFTVTDQTSPTPQSQSTTLTLTLS
ncbi:MAG: putative Ig domain-containing protein [Nitrospirae bacterium]|nr:putative Ig domain-containing protein [Nitrospirota bacterium]